MCTHRLSPACPSQQLRGFRMPPVPVWRECCMASTTCTGYDESSSTPARLPSHLLRCHCFLQIPSGLEKRLLDLLPVAFRRHVAAVGKKTTANAIAAAANDAMRVLNARSVAIVSGAFGALFWGHNRVAALVAWTGWRHSVRHFATVVEPSLASQRCPPRIVKQKKLQHECNTWHS